MLHFTVSRSSGYAYNRWKEEITPDMRTLMIAVAKAIDDGVFYSTDMHRVICEQFDFTEEELARDKGYVEGGAVGMDIYYARGLVEESRTRQKEQEARSALSLLEGSRLGSLKLGWRVFRNCQVVKLESQDVLLQGTRGNRRFTLRTNARAILAAR